MTSTLVNFSKDFFIPFAAQTIDVIAVEGKSISLQCPVSGSDVAMLLWFKNGGGIPLYRYKLKHRILNNLFPFPFISHSQLVTLILWFISTTIKYSTIACIAVLLKTGIRELISLLSSASPIPSSNFSSQLSFDARN